ncbi:hypothetical protein HZA42_05535 [Candidatus Peregrinibacteria bacterium]|nr:hypothetical protein [Candidatus Peregrinibacteria bacterium]
MELFHFKNSDWWKDARLVGMEGQGEAPAKVPENAPSAPASGAEEPPEGVAQKTHEQRVARIKQAAESGDAEKEQSGKAADGRLNQELTPPDKSDKTNDLSEEKVKPALDKVKAFREAPKNDEKATLQDYKIDGSDLTIAKWAEKGFTQAERDKTSTKVRGLLAAKWHQTNYPPDSIPNPDEITELSESGQINYREAVALRDNVDSILKKNDPVEVAKLRITETAKDAYKTARGLLEKIPDAAAGGGFMALLERLMKNLSILMDKIGAWFNKQFKSKKAAIETAAPSKLKIATDYKKDEGVKISTIPESDIPAFADGEIEAVDTKEHTVTIKTSDNKKVTYKNVAPANGVVPKAEIKKGQTVGKSLKEDSVVTVRYFENDKETDPTTTLLTPAGVELKEAAPAAAPGTSVSAAPSAVPAATAAAAVPAPAPSAPPAAPAPTPAAAPIPTPPATPTAASAVPVAPPAPAAIPPASPATPPAAPAADAKK